MSHYLDKDLEFITSNLHDNKIEMNSWYGIGVDHETENEWRTRRIALTIRQGYYSGLVLLQNGYNCTYNIDLNSENVEVVYNEYDVIITDYITYDELYEKLQKWIDNNQLNEILI